MFYDVTEGNLSVFFSWLCLKLPRLVSSLANSSIVCALARDRVASSSSSPPPSAAASSSSSAVRLSRSQSKSILGSRVTRQNLTSGSRFHHVTCYRVARRRHHTSREQRRAGPRLRRPSITGRRSRPSRVDWCVPAWLATCVRRVRAAPCVQL